MVEEEKVDFKKADDAWVTELLLSYGFNPVYAGFKHLRQAIMHALERPVLLNNLSRGLYSVVAEQYEVNPANVERDIRFVIEKAAQTEAFQKNAGKYFPYPYVPSNKQFLTTMYEVIRMMK
ncbi:MAG: sporulation initiation factor Spo0A C-terminal domain-containing protein [Firmicutes bacterium]|nr:sporulation initiation factor Spo0A C-terminal domain-containing protein [Bacillota bacterium]